MFGLNGARVYGVEVPAQAEDAARPDRAQEGSVPRAGRSDLRDPGPRTNREYEALLAERGGLPAWRPGGAEWTDDPLRWYR